MRRDDVATCLLGKAFWICMGLLHGINGRMCQLILNLVGSYGDGVATPFRWHPFTACCVMLVRYEVVVVATRPEASAESPVVSAKAAVRGFAFRCSVANQAAAVALLGSATTRLTQ